MEVTLGMKSKSPNTLETSGIVTLHLTSNVFHCFISAVYRNVVGGK